MMDILVVRHGIAMEREDAQAVGIAESGRPLTPQGCKRTKRAAKGLSRIVPDVDSLLTSPYRRAVETAEFVGKAYGGLTCEETDALLPEADPEELCQVLAARTSGALVAVVGHEPHLGRFLGYCLYAELRSPFDFKKGGACLIHFDEAPSASAGRLSWFLPPRFLRRFRVES
jgi:phosphohistidine phosphatase